MTLFPLYTRLPPLRPLVSSMALYPLFGILALYGPLAALKPFVLFTDLCPLFNSLS